VAEKSRPSKKDVSFSARTPSNFIKHTFLLVLEMTYTGKDHRYAVIVAGLN